MKFIIFHDVLSEHHTPCENNNPCFKILIRVSRLDTVNFDDDSEFLESGITQGADLFLLRIADTTNPDAPADDSVGRRVEDERGAGIKTQKPPRRESLHT